MSGLELQLRLLWRRNARLWRPLAPPAALLHVCRTVCRRAERDVLALAEREPVSADLVRYLNRLSDALFVMARYQNVRGGVQDPLWDSRA